MLFISFYYDSMSLHKLMSSNRFLRCQSSTFPTLFIPVLLMADSLSKPRLAHICPIDHVLMASRIPRNQPHVLYCRLLLTHPLIFALNLLTVPMQVQISQTHCACLGLWSSPLAAYYVEILQPHHACPRFGSFFKDQL